MRTGHITSLFIAAFLWLIIPAHARQYFVATDGMAENPGTQVLPWNIAHAFENAKNGDTIWIKSGNYGAQKLRILASRTSFFGYTTTPGDLDATNRPDSLTTFLATSYDAIYPTLDGLDRATAGTAIDFVSSNREFVILRNFQIRNYQAGISVVGQYHIIDNVIAWNFGNTEVFYNGNAITLYGNHNTLVNSFVLNSAAEGIRVSGNHNRVAYCSVYCNDTTSLHGDTDYYMYISPNTSTKESKYNSIEHCYAERISRSLPHLGHRGHGFCLTISYNHAPCPTGGGYCYDPTQKELVVEHNVIRNSTTKNIEECVMLRGDKVRYNLIEDVTSLSYGTLRVQNSCSYNTFNRCVIKNSYYWKSPTSSTIYRVAGVEFFASYYGDTTAVNVPDPQTNSYPWEVRYAGHHNMFTNCLFENVAAGVGFDSYGDFSYPSYHALADKPVDRSNRKKVVSNQFINCTFVAMATDEMTMAPVNRPSLFIAMRGNEDNSFTNCIFSGFHNFESRYFALNTQNYVAEKHGIIPTDCRFSHCVFHANAFEINIPENGRRIPVSGSPLSAGVNNTIAGTFEACQVTDPQFRHVASRDFTLAGDSPCIDEGIDVLLPQDLAGNPRPSGRAFDIGAYEFQGEPTALNEAERGMTACPQLYPNPADERVRFSSSIPLAKVIVSDSNGRQWLNTSLHGQLQVELGCGNLPANMYVVEMHFDNGQTEKRNLVVVH